jgi:hypothetical protein
MGWPSSPINGQTAVVNGITYTYNSARTAWIRSSSTTFNLFTASNIAPTTPSLGDQWYYIATDVLYEYISDGTSSYWVDTDSLGQVGNITTIADSTLQGNLIVGVDTRYSIGSATGYLRNIYANNVVANTFTASSVTTNAILTANGNVVLSGNIIGNIVPAANVTFDLGSPTQRFRDLWLSGNTINLGGAVLTTDGANVTITNPQGGSFSVTGSSSGSANLSLGNVTAFSVRTTNPISYNFNTITEDTIIQANNYNALSAGPIAIADGKTVTIADGAVWSIV